MGSHPHLFKFVGLQYNRFFRLVITSCYRYYIHTDVPITSNKNDGVNGSEIKTFDLPESPTNCCFSGCANCVWIKYAEDLSVLFNDADDKIKNIIISKIDDPNMKAFLLMELKSVKFKK